MKSILIKNVKLVNPRGTGGELDILMAEGRIVKLSPAIDAGEGMEVIDGRGLMAAPGFVDVHVHFRDPGQTHKEDIFTGAKAAAKGGVTTVVLMANTVPAVDNEETLAYVLEKGRQTGINVLSCTTVTKGMKGEELCDLEGLKAAGAAGFTDDGKPIMNEALVREAMERAAALGLPISFHEEDPAFIDGPGFNRGAASEHFGIGGADRQAEISMIERDIKLALETGAVIDIQHISTKEGVELVRQARKKSGKIHAEATPHHFSLTEKDAIVHGVMAKMNPPLRTEEDRLAIIEGLKDGTIDMIATDHAPHAAAEKAKGIKEAPSGITGLETSFALGITKLVEPGYLSLETLIERMSCGPAEVYGLNTGVIREGGPADLVLFDPDEKWIFDDHASKSSNSPFAGSELKGRVKCTVWGGKVVYSNM